MRRSISALRAMLVVLRRLVKSEKSNGFSNIRLLRVFTRDTTIYRKPRINSLDIISITALSRVIPCAL